MGAHLPIPTLDDAGVPSHALTPDAHGHSSAQLFAQAAERIGQSMWQGAANAPVAALVAEVLERTSGARIRDQARLARQMLLWHHACPPEQARDLTVAAFADRAGALRRSVSRRRLERGAGK